MKALIQVICVGLTLIVTAVCLENLAQNVVYKGEATQSSLHSGNVWPPDKAVDGQLQGQNNQATCSFTQSEVFKSAWWKFTLKLLCNVAYLEIFFRKSTVNRHTGFNVFVFNVSSYTPPSPNGIKVFTQDPFSCPTQVMKVTVNKVTKGVAIFNSKNPPLNTSCTGYEPSFATIEICEVKVMGCGSKHYGEHCEVCSAQCFNRECDAFNGSCIYGCSDHFVNPPDCSNCKDGYYGYTCAYTCGNCKTGTFCNTINGNCPNGCQNRWNGLKCDVCENGFYGDNCTKTCGHCKPGTYCHNVTAICQEGCDNHWDGPQCNVCKRGFYGTNCENTCGSCKDGTYCDRISGICAHGCQSHWNGTKCDVCENGFYGSSCDEECGYCTHNICQKANGHCLFGCQRKWKGVRCDVCRGGYYGQKCEHICGKCKTGTFCNNITGTCPNGCRNRWSGLKCDVCENGFYGDNCMRTCGHCKPRTYCDRETGICHQGCDDHWDGSKCDECKKGFYGTNCEYPCGSCKYRTYCNRISGRCAYGCQSHWQGIKCDVCENGFYGSSCDEECGYCTHNMCKKDNGHCLYGCQRKWKGDRCDVCEGGYYGQKCEHNCGKCKTGTFCNNITGTCPNGCRNRWSGLKCNVCENGFYGDYCTRTCGHCKPGTYCHRETGICHQGCDDHWNGSKCDVCKRGYYGTNCEYPCGSCKYRTYCNRISGRCAYGCQSHWQGIKCDVCENGFYGSSCDEECGYCTHDICKKDNGHCLFGCQRKWEGDRCDVCKGGYYGLKCEHICGKCKSGTVCNNITGTCPNGCRNRWSGSKCDVCENGFYDGNCTQTCGHCKPGTYCHNVTGICHQGCDDHWGGSKCDVCKAGFYGTICENACGNCANGTYCNNITGICTDGCQSQWNGTKSDVCETGFFGPRCNKKCGYCTHDKCTKAEGNCLTGCQGNWQGARCDFLSLPLERSNGGVIGGVVTTLTILVVLVICTVIFLRRRSNSREESKERKGSTVNFDKELKNTYRKPKDIRSNSTQSSLEVHLQSLDFACNVEYYNTNQICKDIKIEDLQNYIATKSEGEKSHFLTEYKKLPPKYDSKCHTAQKKENMVKNRFKTTFPYDHSRVILEEKWDGQDNDYINANYIKDFNGEKRFIAAQGPQKNTLKDFWRLIWQEHIDCIIMLTNLIENGKNKCTKYWPDDNQPMNFGPCKVSLLDETTYAFYTVRQFSVQRKNSPEVRTINHFHYTAWPDHGTPGEIELVQFNKAVTKRCQPGPPLLVHCSAGVGRTGTYIALNELLQEGKETGRINVFEFVKQMREDRMTMVQTVEQYVFLHKAVLCGFQEKGTILSERDLQAKVLTLLNDTSPFNQQTLKKDFQVISALKPVYDKESKADGEKSENRAKNVDMDVLPISKYRPFLTCYVKGRNDYINAVMVPTFTNPNGIIMTQKPLPDTEVDLWRLCMDHEVTATVVLNDTDDGNKWLTSRGDTQHCQSFTIAARDTGCDVSGVVQDTLLISNSGHKANIDVYQIPSGNDDALLKGAKMLLEKEKAAISTSLVISRNGAGPAGIFCVLHNALQQLRMDGEVDIFTTVRQIQTRRPEVITTLEEYRKCYQLVSRSVSSEDIYVNY